VAPLLFHEQSHQVLYVPHDPVFNESLATAVARLGGALWLAQHADPQARLVYAEFDVRRQQFRALTRKTRERLQQIYTTDGPQATAKESQAALKQQAMQDFRAVYAELKASWGGYSGYDAWVAQANNAAFGAQAAYDELVPGFEALFVRLGRNWPAFYDAVKELAARPKKERAQQLKQWAEEQHGLPRYARSDVNTTVIARSAATRQSMTSRLP
jgi:predicted aminopeptidase